jgi:peptide/nickel transport system substrate-binding protein
VARSHTRGSRVTVLTDDDPASTRIGTYLVQVLNRLGFNASRKAQPYGVTARAPLFAGSRPTIQIYPSAWFADYPSAAAFIQAAFSCGGVTNDPGFCNPRIDREMHRAQTLALTDPRAADEQWSHIDRELTEAAAWIPWSTSNEIDFVSKRVGNLQFHPVWLVLFDQLWVR